MKWLCAGMLILLAAMVQGCAYPEPAKVEQKENRPTIGVSGAPEGAILYVDGLLMGKANDYDGTKRVLLIERGKHLIEITSAQGKKIHSETVFLSDSVTKVIQVQP